MEDAVRLRMHLLVQAAARLVQPQVQECSILLFTLACRARGSAR